VLWRCIIADGKNHIIAHDKMWGLVIILGVIECGIFYYWIPGFNIFVFLILYPMWYHLGERYISCDLDLDSMSGQEGRMLHLKSVNIIVGLFGLIFMILSLCYSWCIPKHRHWTSHSVPIGTFLRCVWFIWLPIFIVLNWVGSFLSWTVWEYYFQFYGEMWINGLLLSSFCALCFTDIIHLIMDLPASKNILYTPISKKGKYKLWVENLKKYFMNLTLNH
jgi:hypothetical protein